MTYTFTAEARQDLDEIIDFIARNNPAAAISFVAEIDRKCETLANFPNMGKSYENLALQLRGVLTGNYIIFYRPIENGIEVVRILSRYRDLEVMFSDSDDDN